MPRVTSCNTNAPKIMVGGKGACLIRDVSSSLLAIFAHERNGTHPTTPILGKAPRQEIS